MPPFENDFKGAASQLESGDGTTKVSRVNARAIVKIWTSVVACGDRQDEGRRLRRNKGKVRLLWWEEVLDKRAHTCLLAHITQLTP